MEIVYREEQGLFRLTSGNMEYGIGIVDGQYVGHVYFGKRIEDDGYTYLMRTGEAPYTPSANKRETGAFMDSFPFEYSVWGRGDYRESCLMVKSPEGYRGCELWYEGYRILDGKPRLSGLPATFCKDPEGGDGKTLELYCKDKVLGLRVILRYSIFADSEALLRNVELVNEGDKRVCLEKVLSACLDMDSGHEQVLTLNGSWGRERHMERRDLAYGKQQVSSVRGETSHQEQPFMAVLDQNADLDHGEVYAMHLIYSGNFAAQVEKSQYDSLRMTIGIHPEGFSWMLEPGEHFTAPEAVLVYSDEGLGKMTRTFHDLYRNHLIRSPYLHEKRPVLLNNWEATYFDFNSDKLIAIAREAGKRGIEMLVMDDGWFGCRDSDNSSLGDWFVNEEKLQGTLKELVDRVREEGLLFGIWFEPEMVSPNSLLYRQHPDWAFAVPGRDPVQIRAQYVLDLSRPEVRDYVFEAVANILRSADISYVKWDMNRQLTDVGGLCMGAERQGELFHRYVLGVYELQERLVTEFPGLLLENCSAGGARFDPGMLYYSPQIWCSDDTDAIERLAIQEGTALLYPLSTMGAHVSDCPNHVTGRVTPFTTRGHVAMAGTFGYELDITRISREDQKEIEEQVKQYHQFQPLVREGDYFRIASYSENHLYDCWEVVSKDQRQALVTYVQVLARPNYHSRRIRLKGLREDGWYRLETEDLRMGEYGEGLAQPQNGGVYSGRLLMRGGILVDPMKGDYTSRLFHLVSVDHPGSRGTKGQG